MVQGHTLNVLHTFYQQKHVSRRTKDNYIKQTKHTTTKKTDTAPNWLLGHGMPEVSMSAGRVWTVHGPGPTTRLLGVAQCR